MLRLSVLILWFVTIANVVQAADVVVISSQVTQILPDDSSKITQIFPKGDLLDSNKLINLPAKAEMTVVFASGGVKTMSGPYRGKLEDPLPDNESDPKLVTTLSHFLTEEVDITRTPKSQLPDNLWLVNVSTIPRAYRSYCVAPSTHVIYLWRPENQSQSASTLLIKHKRTGEKAKVVWPSYKTTIKWPDSLAVHYGETYTVKLKTRNGSSFKKLVLYQLPESFPTKSHKVVWMVGRGCIPQANMLLASLR